MAFNIRKSLYDYFTVPQLKHFLQTNDIKIKSNITKTDLFKEIESAVNNGNLNNKIVNQWINSIVEIGAKHVYFCEMKKEEVGEWSSVSSEFGYYNTHKVTGDIHEVYREKQKISNEEIIIYGLGIGLFYEIEKGSNGISYYLPIKVEFNSKKNHLFISYRPNSRLFYSSTLNPDTKMTDTNLINQIEAFIERKLELKFIKDNAHKDKLRKAVYRILEESSGLPTDIQNIIDAYDKRDLSTFIENTNSNYAIKSGFYKSIEDDILNIIEKYICLNWDNQDDFTIGQKCYPYNIALKDCENTTLIQKSSIKESLLTRSAYHDNKKTLRQEKMCESVHMAYEIEDRKCKVVYGVDKHKGKIAFEKYLSMEEMEEIVGNFVQKYYE